MNLTCIFLALFMYLYFHDELPIFFKNYFKRNGKVHTYTTGSASSIHITYKRTIIMATFPSVIEELRSMEQLND